MCLEHGGDQGPKTDGGSKTGLDHFKINLKNLIETIHGAK